MKIPSVVVDHITRMAEWKSVYYPTGMDHAGGHYAQFTCGCEHEMDMRGSTPIDEDWLLCSFHEGMRVHAKMTKEED